MENTEEGQRKIGIKTFLQSLVTAVASIFLALLLPSIPAMIRGLHHHASSQTGVTAVAAGLMENALSPWFWLAFLISFSWFYTVSRSNKTSLRMALFWVPAVGISVLGLGFWIGFTLLLSRFRMQ
jgi:hypothetical protein